MSDVHVRPATSADAWAVEAVRIATWKIAYRGLIPDEHLDALEVTEEGVALRGSREGWQTFVAEVHGEVVGMATYGPCRDEDQPERLELGALYVLPAHWGSGAGGALLGACAEATTLWVLDGNERAQAFYRSHGFVPDGSDLQHPRLGVREIRMVRNLG